MQLRLRAINWKGTDLARPSAVTTALDVGITSIRNDAALREKRAQRAAQASRAPKNRWRRPYFSHMQSVPSSADPELERSANGTLTISGDWTLAHYATLQSLVIWSAPSSGITTLDCSRLSALDTAGAQLLVQLVGPNRMGELAATSIGLDRDRVALLEAIRQAVPLAGDRATKPRHRSLTDLLERIGTAVVLVGTRIRTLLGFVGIVLKSFACTALRPSRWRVTPVVAQLEQIGLNALPIVALLNFMVGSVIAFLGATVLMGFGANAYTVDLVGFSFLREFGILIAAILMAGRTASAFTAQIGAMKANEEIDAIKALDLDYVELLVLPRVLAMLIALPILTFVAMICGIVGGALVCIAKLDIPLAMFISRFRADIPVEHFLVGISKAPPLAFLIACIGCVEGLSVSGSAQSVGQHTTSSVVQSIFVVILLDAIAALFFMEMGW